MVPIPVLVHKAVPPGSLIKTHRYCYCLRFKNTVHVTVAGTVGNWWFKPSEASSCCSSAVNNAATRAMTTSFGSICFGSLIVAVIQALKMLANTARAEGDAGIMACVAECILACLASIVEVRACRADRFPFYLVHSGPINKSRSNGFSRLVFLRTRCDGG
jgi:hypothetical protein